ncbi:DUF6636 domain-containing protein [Actinoplanes sp. NPDC051343]|uniref:DUF6636 domain-containing protein n=1 Tax=Actinoplanes sp. NPDC051343 TaxID=3363906 RepID=UPI0037A5EA65
MAVNPKLAALMLVVALAGCGSPGSSPDVPASATPSARTGLGAPSPVVSVVASANFQSPSKNITCDLTTGAVRCEIIKRDWEPPPKPASCELGWGHGMSIENGRADFVCAGDTVIGTASEVLPYGSSLRAGNVQCDSGNVSLRCVDEKSQHGFTLAVADYNLF